MQKRDLYYERIPTKLLRDDVRYLGNILGKVIKEQEGKNFFNLVEKIRKKCSMPITVLGGAGNLSDVKKLINKFKIIGAAAGSLFVFKGKYRAVLINYPNRLERKPLY